MLYAIISAIVVGLILGVIGKMIVPGSQKHVPLWLTIIVGIVAAFLGNYLAAIFGVAVTSGFDWTRHILQVVLAALGVYAAAALYPKRTGVR